MAIRFTEQFDFSPEALEQLGDKKQKAHSSVLEMASKGELGFTKLPQQDTHDIISLAEQVKKSFQDVVVIGIGGSDLGTRAVHRALHSAYYNYNLERRHGLPRLFFIGDTTDPLALQELLEEVNWRSACLIMVSKSGNTVEQMSTFVYLRDHLKSVVGEEKLRDVIFTVTDAEKGTLREITNKEGYRSLPIPADVGGRFSVFSAVGLFPLAVVGIDITALLKGAADMPVDTADALQYACLQYLAYTERGQHIHVFMPYTYSMREVGFWFRQLWAESLGKAKGQDGREVHVSPTPIASVGPTDQHSQVQLYREGLNDKTYTFVTVKNPAQDFTLPEAFPDLEGVRHLKGHTFQEILQAEVQSTDAALKEVGRPTCRLELDQLDAYHVGQLLFFLELATAYAGELFGINTYDQPGVERGKELMYQLLGRY